MSNKKVYVITGATSGIGNALVKRLAENNIIMPDIGVIAKRKN